TRQLPRAATHSLTVLAKSQTKLRNGYADYPLRSSCERQSVSSPSSSGECGYANAFGLEHDEAACEPIRVLAHELEHPSPDGGPSTRRKSKQHHAQALA